MKFDLSFWRFVIFISIAKSGMWKKGDTSYWLHIGTFTNGKSTAFQFILLPISIKIGLIEAHQ